MLPFKKILNVLSIILVVFSVIYIPYFYLTKEAKEIINADNLNKIYINKMEIHGLGVDGLTIEQKFTEVTVTNDDVNLKIKGNVSYNKVLTEFEASLNTKKSIKDNNKIFLDIRGGNVEANIENTEVLYNEFKKGVILNIEEEKKERLKTLKSKLEKHYNLKNPYVLGKIEKIEQEYKEKLDERNIMKNDEFTSVLYDNIKTNIRKNLINNEIYNYDDGKK